MLLSMRKPCLYQISFFNRIFQFNGKRFSDSIKNDPYWDRTESYRKILFEKKLLPSDLVEYNSSDDLLKKIKQIIESFDYEIYQKNIFFDGESQFELLPSELFEILSAENERKAKSLVKYFAVSKCNDYENHQTRVKFSEEKKRLKMEKYPDNNRRSGICNDAGELEYGLWHNCLFTKMKRSSVSHLYDKRLLSSFIIPSNPRLLIDLNWIPEQDFFRVKKICSDLRDLLAFNKYQSKQPFTIEFLRNESFTNRFENIVDKILPWWNDQNQFQYAIHNTKPIDFAQSLSSRLLYFTPTAKKAITLSELLDESNIFVIPAYTSRNRRDPVFNKINNLWCKSYIEVRRLPTSENIVWNHYHGVLPLNIVFSILSDMRFNVKDDWNIVFQRYLIDHNGNRYRYIKSQEELVQKYSNSIQIRDKRKKSVENFIRNRTF